MRTGLTAVAIAACSLLGGAAGAWLFGPPRVVHADGGRYQIAVAADRGSRLIYMVDQESGDIWLFNDGGGGYTPVGHFTKGK
jgi:hypothetical protein